MARDGISRSSHGAGHRGTPVKNTPTEPDESANPCEPRDTRSHHQGPLCAQWVEAPVGPRVKPVMPAATDAAERICEEERSLHATPRRSQTGSCRAERIWTARSHLLAEATRRTGSGGRTTAAPCVDLCPTPQVPVSPESGDASDFPVQTVLGLRGKNALRASAPFDDGTTVSGYVLWVTKRQHVRFPCA